MLRTPVLRAEVNCNDLIKEIYQLNPQDDYNELQPLAEYIENQQITYQELQEITEVLQEHGIINVYNEFTEWSQKNGVGEIQYFNNPITEDEDLFPEYIHLITKQGKLLIERLCPELRQLNQPLSRGINISVRNSLFLQPSMKVCYN